MTLGHNIAYQHQNWPLGVLDIRHPSVAPDAEMHELRFSRNERSDNRTALANLASSLVRQGKRRIAYCISEDDRSSG
ncbi:hypothetical protein DICSQDRAFT_175933 [Dichomitus squalens LYAD-421 SS1]|uniref:Uncharacterized protein n=1 Tax=Dichomitus squalens (strain LYAD-421) TaxID=732165 RepID=R7SGY8_DICSQ|nr:uncharacterized protein DICSQDRAFT_175933 [Dichomitus squalens LYAD-421 SS1]EJF55421.1 hypothetical protein DICSQDRAFT_175933 [Dichomitus squalens LYAD-421 SS1]